MGKKSKENRRQQRQRKRQQKRRSRRKKKGPSTRDAVRSEWVVGCGSGPGRVGSGADSYQPEICMVVSTDFDLVLGQAIARPGEEGLVKEALAEARTSTAGGMRHRPSVVRVQSPSIQNTVQEVLGPNVTVVVAPTPEIDDILQLMAERFSEEGVGGGRLPDTYLFADIEASHLADFFDAMHYLHTVAPWDIPQPGETLRLDIDDLELEGLCALVLTGDPRAGFLLFRSDLDYESVLDAQNEPELEDFAASHFCVLFQEGKELPASMRREVASHGWAVASAGAYPLALTKSPAGYAPVAREALELVTRCAYALAGFFVQAGAQRVEKDGEPVSMSIADDQDRVVRVTMPYESFILFEEDEAIVRHHLDRLIVDEMLMFAEERFGRRWSKQLRLFSASPAEMVALARPWMVYECVVGQKRVVEHYLDEVQDIEPADRSWLEAQTRAWLSLWQVTGTEAGEWLEMTDLLTGESRRVRDKEASRGVDRHAILLGRIVDYEGMSLLCGAHPQPLGPDRGQEVVARARKYLRRKRQVPIERLRDARVSRRLVELWLEGVEEALAWRPESLQTMDGQEMLFVSDHFDFKARQREKVALAVRSIADDTDSAEDKGDSHFVFLEPAEGKNPPLGRRFIGSARLGARTLTVESHAVERADALRSRVEAACGELIRHRMRELADPLSEVGPLASGARGAPSGIPEPAELTPELQKTLRDTKSELYAGWADAALPALGGRSAREAVAQPGGREKVDRLLQQMEFDEASQPEGTRFDFSAIRRDLGLP